MGVGVRAARLLVRQAVSDRLHPHSLDHKLVNVATRYHLRLLGVRSAGLPTHRLVAAGCAGAIPTELGLMTALQNLHLYGNKFTGATSVCKLA